MENSTNNFKLVSPEYIHHVHYTCDTGANINFLANYTYISLDTFRNVRQNIGSYLDAWFTFLSSDAPADIVHLTESYPEFKEYYHDIALFRTNPRELMNMYSEALQQMDRNTANYMIEEVQKELEDAQVKLAVKQEELTITQEELATKQEELTITHEELVAKQEELDKKDAYIKELEEQLKLQK